MSSLRISVVPKRKLTTQTSNSDSKSGVKIAKQPTRAQPMQHAVQSSSSSAATAASSSAASSGRLLSTFGCRSVSVFEKLNAVGEGTYGTVYRVRDRESDEICALKKIKLMPNNGFPLTSIREIKILSKLHHPNIVRLHEVVVGKLPERCVYYIFSSLAA
jgi:cell division cycle 2-like